MSRPDPGAGVLDLALPGPEIDLDVDPGEIVLTDHAVLRYRERVEGVSRRLAARRLREIVRTAVWRSRPMWWTDVVLYPGVLYGYAPGRPDVCLLVRERAVVTVFSRSFLARNADPRIAALRKS